MGSVTRIQESQAPAIKSGKVSAEQMLAEAVKTLSARTVKRIGPTGEPMNIPVAWQHGRSPSSEERTVLLRIVNSIHVAMQTPATEEEMAEALEDLFNSRSLYGADVVAKTRIYSLVLQDVPGPVLKAAIWNVVCGKAEGIGKDVPPTDVLLGYCERLQGNSLARANFVQQMLELPEQPAPSEPLSEEHCARMRQKIAALAKNVRKA